MKSAAQSRAILEKLQRQHPNADTELTFDGPYQLTVATILSAQTTDAGVNRITPALFSQYPDASALAEAVPGDLERLIRPTGFYRQKARTLIDMARTLIARYGARVPAQMDDLTELPGVGRKTANVILGHAFGIPGFAVDRHVLRVAGRLGLAGSDDPVAVEREVCGLFPPAVWTLASDTLILHGRRVCRPRPLCDRCSVRAHCAYFRALGPQRPSARGAARRSGPASAQGRAGSSGNSGKADRRGRTK
jgi:endonuclease III